LIYTNGTAAVASLPDTVVPVRLPTAIVAPNTKFAPLIVIEEVGVTLYVTELGLTLLIEGCDGFAEAVKVSGDPMSPVTVAV
jgi:hypothetical protein